MAYYFNIVIYDEAYRQRMRTYDEEAKSDTSADSVWSEIVIIINYFHKIE